MSSLTLCMAFLLSPLAPGERHPAHLASEPPRLRRAFTELAAPTAASPLDLRAHDGARVGTWRRSGATCRVETAAGAIDAPRFEQWHASADGRTVVGAGDPLGSDHAAALEVRAYRDGREVARLGERFAPGASIAVGDDGAFAVAGGRAGDPARPLASAFDAGGRPLWAHDLPAGTEARDAVLFGERLLVRAVTQPEGGALASILSLDERGATTLLELSNAVALVGFPRAERALVLSRETLVCIDARDGGELWRRDGFLRPAGRHAWELWRSARGDAFALVTAELRRPGAPQRGELLLLDPRDGTTLERAPLEVRGPAAEVDLVGAPGSLAVRWCGAQEVFAWAR